MKITDTSVKRPVFAIVINLLLLTFGLVAFSMLPLREYPDIETPIVSVSTDYTGASAEIIETKITQVLENRISGIEGIKSINSSSRNDAQTSPLSLISAAISMPHQTMYANV